MSRQALLIRFALYGAPAALAFSGVSGTLALAQGVFAGLVGLGLEIRLRSFYTAEVAFLSTLALLTSGALAGPKDASGPFSLMAFGASAAVFCWLATKPEPSLLRLGIAGALATGPTAAALIEASWWTLSPGNLLASLFGARGLFYGTPLLWAGFLGLVGLRGERSGLARLALFAIVPGTLALLFATDEAAVSSRTLTWLPFLAPGLAHSFERLRSFAARRPERVLAGAAGLLVVWNVLFMEQYRRRLLPSDDTVSFAQVTSNSAGLLSRSVGTPVAWPANWIFAWRFQAPAEKWDAIADRSLFANAKATTATIEFGEDSSLFAPEQALLLEGFGARRTCERGWCRDLDGGGRLLLPLREPGHGDLVIRLRARGQGALSLSLNRANTSVGELENALADMTLRVPSGALAVGINVLSFAVSAGGRATLDRLTLERALASGSAR